MNIKLTEFVHEKEDVTNNEVIVNSISELLDIPWIKKYQEGYIKSPSPQFMAKFTKFTILRDYDLCAGAAIYYWWLVANYDNGASLFVAMIYEPSFSKFGKQEIDPEFIKFFADNDITVDEDTR